MENFIDYFWVVVKNVFRMGLQVIFLLIYDTSIWALMISREHCLMAIEIDGKFINPIYNNKVFSP